MINVFVVRICSFTRSVRSSEPQCKNLTVLRHLREFNDISAPGYQQRIFNLSHIILFQTSAVSAMNSCFLSSTYFERDFTFGHKWYFMEDFISCLNSQFYTDEMTTPVNWYFNAIHTGGGLFSTSRPVNCSKPQKETSHNLETW